MKETVSIIIPVYNSEPYLSRCVDSVLAQSYADIEVLLIDDGSTDNSYKICREYAQRDNRVRAVHQENKGASSARNKGLDIATGRYIMFCDSDDIVSADWTKHMIESLSGDNVILPICGNCSKDSELGKKSESDLKRNQYIPKTDLFKNKLNYKIGFLWNTLFYKSIIKNHNLRFREQGDKADYNEDLLFVTSYLGYIDGFVYTGYDDYAYLTREESLSRSFTPYYFEKFAEKFEISVSLIHQYGTLDDLKSNASYFFYHFLLSYKDAVNNNKFQRFKEIVTSDVVKDCLLYADTSKEDKREMKLLKSNHVTVLWIYNQLLKLKGR